MPLEDSIGELLRLQAEGKIRHIGVSNFGVSELARARRITRIVSVQNRYNAADRSSADVLAVCERDGLAFIPWAPIGRALANGNLEAAARTHGVSAVEIAIAWLLAKSPAMLPIPGTGSVVHLERNVAAAGIRLSAGEVAELG